MQKVWPMDNGKKLNENKIAVTNTESKFSQFVIYLQNLSGAMNRFSKEIGKPEINQKLTDTMIRPILEYAFVIWAGRNIVAERKLDSILHRSTRTTLRLPYYHLARRYLPFEQRLARLGTLTFHGRLVLARCLTMLKIQKRIFETNVRAQLMAARPARNMGVRHARPYNVPVGRQTCVTRLMNTYNKLHRVMDVARAVNTNKFKLKKYLATNQFSVTKNAL